jgi:ABC-2 type transport system ATP-binding protein
MDTVAPRAHTPPVHVVDVMKSFGSTQALDGVSMDVPAASIVGLIGPSGCGKTTLLRILTGVVAPDGGTVQVLGREPQHFSVEDRRSIGYQAQAPVLFPHLSLWGNLSFVASLYGVPLRHRRKRLRDLLRLVDLWPGRHTRLRQASGGMQRRLALAATLVHRPVLVFLDEPTAGVDPILRERFWSYFQALRDGGTTIVISTQYVGEAAQCDHIAVMKEGRLVAFDTPAGLSRRAYGGKVLEVRLPTGDAGAAREVLGRLSVVREVSERDGHLSVVVPDTDAALDSLRSVLDQAALGPADVSLATADYDEVFVRLIRSDAGERVPGDHPLVSAS